MKSLQCSICEKGCHLLQGQVSGCGLYDLQDGRIVERYPGQYLVACPISIETVPILHFHPGGKFLQITTTGCNFRCPGCISTMLVKEMPHDSKALQHLSPDAIVARAVQHQCAGVVFLMNDPLAALPSFLAVAKKCREKGLMVGCSSNSYFTLASMEQILPYLDFINIGMKGFSDKAYQCCGAPALQPVLRNLEIMHTSGVHVEVSCILTRSNSAEISALAHHLAGIGKEIPLQVMRFIPFESASIDQEPTIRDAESFCRQLREVLDFVYLFNTPGSELLHTDCPACKATIVQREFYGPMGAKIRIPPSATVQLDQCQSCGCALPIVGDPANVLHQEGDFEGGYPLTRALEMVEAILISIGINRMDLVARGWEYVLQDGGLQKFHQTIQNPRRYLDAIRFFGKLTDAKAQAEELVRYLEAQLQWIEEVANSAERQPRVYYAMGKPLFYFNGDRLENQLVETAGGISVNRELPAGGRPGRSIEAAVLNRLNPDTIFISSFLSNSVEDFLQDCLEQGIDVDAIRQNRVFTHPCPGGVSGVRALYLA